MKFNNFEAFATKNNDRTPISAPLPEYSPPLSHHLLTAGKNSLKLAVFLR